MLLYRGPHLKLGGFVLGQRVVHVEAVELDLLEVQASVDENSAKNIVNECAGQLFSLLH